MSTERVDCKNGESDNKVRTSVESETAKIISRSEEYLSKFLLRLSERTDCLRQLLVKNRKNGNGAEERENDL